MELLDQLQTLCETVDNTLENVNKGGCCVFAVEIAKYLKKKDMNPRLRVSWREVGTHLNAARANVNNVGDAFEWDQHGVKFGHVIVEFRIGKQRYHVDSTGVHKAKRVDPAFGWKLYAGFITVDEAIPLANGYRNWNREFDRKQIPAMRKMCKEMLA